MAHSRCSHAPYRRDYQVRSTCRYAVDAGPAFSSPPLTESQFRTRMPMLHEPPAPVPGSVQAMKDITAVYFGFIIAYLLPGLTGYYALSFWSSQVRAVFTTFISVNANVGLFFLVVLTSLVIGLQVTVVRWILFEKLCTRLFRLPLPLQPAEFAKLGTEGLLEAFRGAVDEHYRYHQFWGGMAVVLPILFSGWLVGSSLTKVGAVAWAVVFTCMELVTAMAAIDAWVKYTERARRILGG